MSLLVKPTMFSMILSTSVQLASATARGRTLCKTGELIMFHNTDSWST